MNINLDSPIAIHFLDRLKNHSAAAHKKLENLTVSTSILSPDMKIGDYCHYLSLMQDVHQSIEEIVYPMLSTIISDLKEREKGHLIEDDLSYLNYTKRESVLIFKTEPLTIPFALGMLYVTEGSSLGGRYILKNVTKVLGMNDQKGVSYFTGYGDTTGSYWKVFLNILTAEEQKNDSATEIIAGVVYAFDCIYNHFLNTVKNEN